MELKAKFDEGGLSLQNYINNTLIPELEASGVLEILRTKSGEMKYIRINGDGAIEISADNVTWVATASSGHVILDKNNAVLPQRSRLEVCELHRNGQRHSNDCRGRKRRPRAPRATRAPRAPRPARYPGKPRLYCNCYALNDLGRLRALHAKRHRLGCYFDQQHHCFAGFNGE